MAFDSLTSKLGGIFSRLRSHGKLSEKDIADAMREVRLALLEADVNYKVAKEFVAAVTVRAMGEEVAKSLTPAQQVIKIVNEQLTMLMGMGARTIKLNSKPPTVIMMCGLQGSGKTTHCAKLAKMYKGQGRRPMLVACDIYRPAAIDQLRIVGEQAGAEVFELGTEKPTRIVKKALSHAKDYGFDIVIIDTAGRLQID
ncbi:MAG: signal recognition particle receptor subunit alpha, partial [Oscillospiraceae bacterium]